jgi:hypothetical protein
VSFHPDVFARMFPVIALDSVQCANDILEGVGKLPPVAVVDSEEGARDCVEERRPPDRCRMSVSTSSQREALLVVVFATLPARPGKCCDGSQ